MASAYAIVLMVLFASPTMTANDVHISSSQTRCCDDLYQSRCSQSSKTQCQGGAANWQRFSLTDTCSYSVTKDAADAVNPQQGLDATLVYRTGLQIGAVVLLIVLLLLFWAYLLRKEINKRKALEKQLRYAATHDHLTNLVSRNLLEQLVAQAIAVHRRYKRMFALLFIDIDGFKPVNDNYGHLIGDQLLITIAKLLKQSVRDSDIVARVGGDEFIIVIHDIESPQTAISMAKKIIAILSEPMLVDAHHIQVGASVGISLYPNDGDKVTELIKVADDCMYQAKGAEKSHYNLSGKNL